MIIHLYWNFYLSPSESSTEKIVVGSRHLEAAMQDHIPFGLYGINLKPPSDSKVAWSDVGGLADTKKILEETLKWPTQVCKSLHLIILNLFLLSLLSSYSFQLFNFALFACTTGK